VPTPNPSVFGQDVTLDASVAGGPDAPSGVPAPSGSVTFRDGSTVLGTSTLSGGHATLHVASLNPGLHSLSATYGGGANFAGSSGTASLTVNRDDSVTTLTPYPSPSTFGQDVILYADVTHVAGAPSSLPIPAGTVTFFDGPLTLGTVPLWGIQAVFDAGTPNAGTHAYRAVYSGDQYFNGSSVTTNEIVNKAPTHLLAASAVATLNPFALPLFQLSATLTSTVTGKPVPGKLVTMRAGGTVVCQAVTNASGTATCSGTGSVPTIVLNGGYTATFGGDGNYLPTSTSAGLIG
jgi:hypothetical protein